jgi:hypothetical protein
MNLAEENRETLLAIAEQFTATNTKVAIIIGIGEDGKPSLVLGDGISYQDYLSISIGISKLVLQKMEDERQGKGDTPIKPSMN